MFHFRFVSLVVCCTLVGQSAAADPAQSLLYPADNLQGTKSVMVRHTSAGATDPSAAATRIVDKNITQASATEPLGSLAADDPAKAAAETASAAASLAATDLLMHAMEAPKSSPLPGHALTLLQAISPSGANRNMQLLIARAYWKLAAAEGDYNWAVDEADQLDRVSQGTAAVDATVLATARASAQSRLLEAKLSAVTAQQELADLLGIPANNPLPLATDPPLVGAYRTYFDTLYAGRLPPPRLRLIDRTLPIRRETIETHVAAVQAAASAVHFAEDARAKGQSDLPNLLFCEAELSRQRRSFLAAVRDYNLEIAEYALAVADPNVPTDRVIGMLIRMRPTAALSTSAAAPPSSDPTSSHPLPSDSLMQPALPQGSRPGPAAGSAKTGSPTTPPSTAGSNADTSIPPSNATTSPNATVPADPTAPSSPSGPLDATASSNSVGPSNTPAPANTSGPSNSTGPTSPATPTGTADPLAPSNPATVVNPFAPQTAPPSSPTSPGTPPPHP